MGSRSSSTTKVQRLQVGETTVEHDQEDEDEAICKAAVDSAAANKETENKAAENQAATEKTAAYEAVEDDRRRSQVEAVFEATDGSRKTVTFTQRPLGLIYTGFGRLVVKGFRDRPVEGCHAKQVGVQKGWKLVSVRETDVTGWTGNRAQLFFERNIDYLPVQRGSKWLPIIASTSE